MQGLTVKDQLPLTLLSSKSHFMSYEQNPNHLQNSGDKRVQETDPRLRSLLQGKAQEWVGMDSE